uniref:RNA helicase n=1 Tax=Steinernema glaseri TaxID=37863 RepID=A0A1I7YPP6_9BILA
MLKLVRYSGGLLHQLRSRVGVVGFCSSSEDTHFGVRKPLGDQKTLFYQHHKKQQRIGHEDRFERKQFHGHGYARPGAHLGNFGGGGFDPKALRVKGSFGRGGEHRSKPIDWENEELTPIKKDFYEESTAVSARSEQEIAEWIDKNEVTLTGPNIPRPVFKFEEAGFPSSILDRLTKNYETPSVIQSISWPIAMSGRDIISIAKTGSGKTIGFMLPGIVHTLNQAKRNRGEGPSVLVLLPTRELAQQVQEVITPYCRDNGLSLTCVFGGSGRTPQINALRQGVDVLVGTPGRLLDFLDSGYTTLRRCSFVVLDEADRMLDMGFEPQMRRILGQIRPDRQTLMFSATWPKEVRDLARDFQKDAAFLNVGSMELSANHNITQKILMVEEQDKSSRFLELLDDIMDKNKGDCKTLVFCATKRKCDELTRSLRRQGYPCLCIHGDKAQTERDWVLKEFKQGKTPILLATDVAARGLDVDDIKFVVNYDYPNSSEDYIHRIGRTGRRDKKGTAYTFFSPTDGAKAADLIKVLSEAQQEVPEDLQQLASSSFVSRKNGSRQYGGGNNRRYGGKYGGGGNRSYGGKYGGGDDRSYGGSYGGGGHNGGGYKKYRGQY